MEITQAQGPHVPEIVEIWREFMDFHRDIDPRFPTRKNAHLGFEKHLRDLMQADDTLVLVAVDDGRVVAFALSQLQKSQVFERGEYGVIDTMAVKSDWRRQGVGERLLGKIDQWFDAHGIDSVELSVASRNQVGYSFWEKHGFRDYMHRLYLKK